MATIYPFKALRPRADLVEQVAAVPYDVVNRAEAQALAQGNPHTFLHVTKPEIDLADDVGLYDDAVYSQGAKALKTMINDGVMVQDKTECLYAYALTMNGRTQTGFVLCASTDEYDENIVRKHEFTRPDKEDDRVKNIEALGAQSGTVFLVHRQSDMLAAAMTKATQAQAAVDFVAADGIRHQLWTIADSDDIASVVNGFDALGPIYIADGHHRSAAASRVAKAQREAGQDNLESQRFLAVSFPEDEMLIMDYNRVVQDLGDYNPDSFLAKVSEIFNVSPGRLEASQKHHFEMYLGDNWYTLAAKEGTWDPKDPVERLDVSILQTQLLKPLLGIEDPRRDKRIGFVGGIRGPQELEKRVAEGCAVAFKLCATSIEELLAIADAGEVMPPKSTWFEPKLRDGLAVHLI